VTNQDALRELKTVLLKFYFSRQEKAAIQIGINALEEWCRNPDPPPDSVPVRIGVCVRPDGKYFARGSTLEHDDPVGAIRGYAEPGVDLVGIMTGYFPRPQVVEVKAVGVEVIKETI
jgi:hypothetical protein